MTYSILYRKFVCFVMSLSLLLLVNVPVQAQKKPKCNTNPDKAVACFVKNAVQSGLTSIPPGMTLSQYQAYGVSVSEFVRTPQAVVFLLGLAGSVADALPPSNAGGGTNQTAQDAAVNAIVEAAVQAQLVSLPSTTELAQLQLFARDIVGTMGQYTGVDLEPGMFLRFLDSILSAATGSNGTVDWNTVNAQIATYVDSLISLGVVKLPPSLDVTSIKQFGSDVTVAIHSYKQTTGRTSL